MGDVYVSRLGLQREVLHLRQRAQRAEAECERLRREVETLRLYGNKDCTAMADEALATPPPEVEPDVATTFIGTLLVGDPLDERDGPWMDRKAWKRMNDLPAGTHIYASSEPLDAPHTPEQAHGDALSRLHQAARGRTRSIYLDTTHTPDADAETVRKALTASGVPYVPEGLKRLPDDIRQVANSDDPPLEELPRSILNTIAVKIERALASAPADGYKLVPVEPNRKMLEELRDRYTGDLIAARQAYFAMIAAAPSDGGSDD